MSRAIPMHLLGDTVTIQIPTGKTDRDRKPIYTETELSNVRVTPVKQYMQGTNGETKDDKLTLVIDCVQSAPAGFLPKALQRVVYDGEVYTIRTVQPCKTKKGEPIHHYEAALV